jgi:cellulose synthase/poly-beta-1,6-N-acetylglucosamine synthase-like glycosyltransferase
MTTLEIIYFLIIFIILYTYIGYPASMWIAARLVRVRNSDGLTEYQPAVSIMIAAYNEEQSIYSTVMNKLDLDYPKDKLEIVVISDCSSDRTDEICQEICLIDKRVRFLCQAKRGGKTAALNHAVQTAKGEIIVFSDANSIYRKDALLHLVNRFKEERVGYATGHMVYLKVKGNSVEEGCSSYIRYENFIRTAESRAGSVVGVNGGIDAVRKELYEKISEDLISDFVIPLLVVEKGYRVVYEPKAVLEEYALTDTSKEFKMRVRVIVRAFHALRYMKSLFNVFKYPVFSYQLICHKLLRYMIPEFLLCLYVINIVLYQNSLYYKILFWGQSIFYGAAIAGYLLQRMGRESKLFYIPFYFSLINVAAGKALIDYLKGKRQVTWQPRGGN